MTLTSSEMSRAISMSREIFSGRWYMHSWLKMQLFPLPRCVFALKRWLKYCFAFSELILFVRSKKWSGLILLYSIFGFILSSFSRKLWMDVDPVLMGPMWKTNRGRMFRWNASLDHSTIAGFVLSQLVSWTHLWCCVFCESMHDDQWCLVLIDGFDRLVPPVRLSRDHAGTGSLVVTP